jgi:peroxiredoxin
MKRNALYAFILICFAIIFVSGCQSGGKTFRIKGELSSAKAGDTIYLEHRGLAGIERLDSAKINKNGSFKFTVKAPENPEFYQLRLGHQLAPFAVDSVETLVIKANASDLYGTLSIENSPVNDQLKQIDQQYNATAAKIRELMKQHQTKIIDDVTYVNLLDSALNEYKTFATKVILGNPASAAAYYALFQKVDDYLIFDPYDKKDYAMFGAVATSWKQYYPESARTEHLYNFTMNALRARRQEEERRKILENVPIKTESALPDIVLPDVNGNKIALSSLKNKVVVIDFTVYNSDFSPKHNIDLNTIYSKYKNRGLEIYQISFDSDEHFWKNASLSIPWIAVHDSQSVYSQLLSMYNVRNLPTSFILNREGSIVARVEDITKLESELNKVL